ncbi:hypothetical protein L596_001347 [Steinernema carpocapsae]|uniref:Uncharacterized protein n=1 Tax=Steinernema carpocapsae TaxID=34508 RepID=A0A4U8UN08_STECR|nr:hypothetical protein L596_001347 [Steinernema carpocapsae]
MEFTPLQFIDEVLLSLIKTTSKKRTSTLNASVLVDLSSYWGEKAEFLTHSHFDLDLHFCYIHKKVSYLISSSALSAPSVCLCLRSLKFVGDLHSILRYLRITDFCQCSVRQKLNMSKMLVILRDYMRSAGILPKATLINLTSSNQIDMAGLYSFLLNDLWAKEIRLKLQSISDQNRRFLQRFMDTEMLVGIEIEVFATSNSPVRCLLSYTQNDVLKVMKFPTDHAQTHATEIIKMWVRNPQRKSRELFVFHVQHIVAFIRNGLFLMKTMEMVISEVSSSNPNVFVTCTPVRSKRNVYLITVAGSERQLIVHWHVKKVHSDNGFIQLTNPEYVTVAH